MAYENQPSSTGWLLSKIRYRTGKTSTRQQSVPLDHPIKLLRAETKERRNECPPPPSHNWLSCSLTYFMRTHSHICSFNLRQSICNIAIFHFDRNRYPGFASCRPDWAFTACIALYLQWNKCRDLIRCGTCPQTVDMSRRARNSRRHYEVYGSKVVDEETLCHTIQVLNLEEHERPGAHDTGSGPVFAVTTYTTHPVPETLQSPRSLIYIFLSQPCNVFGNRSDE